VKARTRQRALIVVNGGLFLCALLQLVTAVGFVTGLAGGPFWVLHRYSGFLMLALIISHLVLNFGWIQSLLKKKNRE